MIQAEAPIDVDEIDVRLLGPPTLHVAGREVDVGGPQQQAVLALLALRPGQQVRTDTIIDALWESEPPPRARTTMQTYISRYRRVLDPATAAPGRTGSPTRDRGALLRTVADGYVLAVDPLAVDATRFERLLHSGRRARADGDLDGARSQLRGRWASGAALRSPA